MVVLVVVPRESVCRALGVVRRALGVVRRALGVVGVHLKEGGERRKVLDTFGEQLDIFARRCTFRAHPLDGYTTLCSEQRKSKGDLGLN